MADTTEQGERRAPRLRASLLGALASIAAPAALVVTGTLYVAGYSRRDSLLSNFGLSAGAVDVSLQDTMSNGYLAVLALLVLTAFLALGQLLYHIFHRSFLSRWVKFGAYNAIVGGGTKLGLSRKASQDLIGIGSLIGVMLLTGIVAGSNFGLLEAFLIKREVDGGCGSSCFTYYSSKLAATGKLVLQDHDQTFVYTDDGLRILATPDISHVTAAKAGARGLQVRESVAGAKRQLVYCVGESIDPIVVCTSREGLELVEELVIP